MPDFFASAAIEAPAATVAVRRIDGRLVRFGSFSYRLAKGLAEERTRDIRETAGRVIVVTLDGVTIRRMLCYHDPSEALRCAERMQQRYGGVIGRYRVAGRPDSWGYCVHPEGADGEFTFDLD